MTQILGHATRIAVVRNNTRVPNLAPPLHPTEPINARSNRTGRLRSTHHKVAKDPLYLEVPSVALLKSYTTKLFVL